MKVEYLPVNGLRLWADASYIGENYLDRANLFRVDERVILNAGVMFERRGRDPGWSVSLEGKNLDDNRITDVAGYPMPGRSFFLTFLVRF